MGTETMMYVLVGTGHGYTFPPVPMPGGSDHWTSISCKSIYTELADAEGMNGDMGRQKTRLPRQSLCTESKTNVTHSPFSLGSISGNSREMSHKDKGCSHSRA
jgi:hypothetical protein